MIEITKRGMLPKEIVYDGKCNHCKTEFRFSEDEGEVVYDQRDGDYVKIDCPLCTYTVNVAKKYPQ